MTMEVNAEGSRPQAGLPGAPRSWRRQEEPSPGEGAWLWDSLILDFGPPEPCYLKPAVLGHFLQWPQDTHNSIRCQGG